MAESTEKPEEVPVTPEGDDDDEITPGYKTPAKVDLKTIENLDADDESLVKYKKQLLGQTDDVLDEGGPNVLLKKLVFAPEDHKEVELDLTGDLSKLKNETVVIKEGIRYRMKVIFRVQREIVSGLRYFQTAYRKGIKVDKSNHMVGSYGPKTEPHVFQTPLEDAPSGMLSRGAYTVKSLFTDDDKHKYLEWEWSFHIKKEWE